MLSSSGAIGLYGENAVAIGAKAKAQSSASVAIGANTVAIADTAGNFSSSSKRPILVLMRLLMVVAKDLVVLQLLVVIH